MTQRERFLAILVAGLLICGVLWWGIDKYRTAIRVRDNQLTTLQQEQQRLIEQQLQGEYANRQMGEYIVRSLPGDTEQAQSRYQQWLLGIVQANQLSDASVDPTSSRPMGGGLYQQFGFRVLGKTEIPNLIDLLHTFYATDYLHRIRDLSVRPSKGGGFNVELTIEAIALLAAPADLPPPAERSWRVDGDRMAYLDPILNRNFFQPPNAAPRYDGPAQVEAVAGRQTPIPLTFKDNEGQTLTYELAGQAPEGVVVDPRSGTLNVKRDQTEKLTVLVRVTDNGYPQQSTEQSLTINVVDPPPPPEPEPPKLKFDDATQTVLTALVQGRDEWTAWMHVRTRDQTLRLKVGDQFEIGSLKGTVVEVTPRDVTLEIDDRRFTLKPAGNLSEAAKRAEED